LVDSEMICNEALSIQLGREGFQEDASSLLARYRGAKMKNIVDDLQQRHGASFSSDFVGELRQTVSTLFATDLRRIDGIAEALSAMDLPMCIASSGPVEKIRQALEVTGLRHYFDGRIFSSYDLGSWKPEPDLFLFAAKSMGFDPAACAVIEDSEIGIQAATAGKMRSFWYRPDGTQELAGIYPDTCVFAAMSQLPALVMNPR
jgi:HAD superfamily hydrolase (TIGR01509 family)